MQLIQVLFVDDEQVRYDSFMDSLLVRGLKNDVFVYHVKSAPEAIAILDNPANDMVFDVAYLDYSLVGYNCTEAETGMAVAKHIVSMDSVRRPLYVVAHSLDETKAFAMSRLLQNNSVRSVPRAYGEVGFYDPISRAVRDRDYKNRVTNSPSY